MPETTVTRPDATVAVDRLTLATAEVRAADPSMGYSTSFNCFADE